MHLDGIIRKLSLLLGFFLPVHTDLIKALQFLIKIQFLN